MSGTALTDANPKSGTKAFNSAVQFSVQPEDYCWKSQFRDTWSEAPPANETPLTAQKVIDRTADPTVVILPEMEKGTPLVNDMYYFLNMAVKAQVIAEAKDFYSMKYDAGMFYNNRLSFSPPSLSLQAVPFNDPINNC